MPYKDPEKQRAAQAAHYVAHKDRYRESSRNFKDRRNQIVNAAKDRPCNKCGVKYPPRVMDFHHSDPKTKLHGIGDLIRRGTQKALLEEIAKCEILCANCHRLHHMTEGELPLE